MDWITTSFVDSFESGIRGPAEKRPRIARNENEDPFSVIFVGDRTETGYSKPWTEKHQPKTLDDLVINKKKVSEFESWLKNVWKNGRSKLLLVTGPPGSGKTSTLRVLCKSLKVSIIEWSTPVDIRKDDALDVRQKSSAQLFEEFILRSTRYSSVLCGDERKRLVLVKDVPNVFFSNSEKFHEILIKRSGSLVSPLVFIVTGNEIIRELFPDNVRVTLNMVTINFNPVTQSSVLKALQRIIVSESKNKSLPSKTDLVDICDSTDGDLRSAILKLQFSLAHDEPIFKVPKMATAGSSRVLVKKPSKGSVERKIETDNDKKIDFFKSVGRVLYPKKEATSGGGYKFVHSPESIAESFATEPNKLINILHENYTDKFSSVRDMSDASRSLALADVLMNCWEGRDSLVEYGLTTAVRSLMTYNRNPAPRAWKPISKSRIREVEDKRKENLAVVRRIFPDVQCESEVLLDIIPYLTKLDLHLEPDQKRMISSIAYYKV